MAEYFTVKQTDILPRLPLQGNLDLTYRCNNNCRHCWVRIPPDAADLGQDLSFDEIRRIVDQARVLGTREWAVSGGEPLLRPDFPEIFDYITRKSTGYSLNTNGTLITSDIARLLKRKGSKMIALYGATTEVNDFITRNPGSFEAVLRGMSYLREAGAAFTVQLVPMKSNYHQWQAMIDLARSHSPLWRCGAGWLHLSASGSPAKNAEIAAQRLSPAEVVALDPPDLSFEERAQALESPLSREYSCARSDEDFLFARCIRSGREFHVDPYGRMGFCCFVADPALRYDLRRGNFREAWEKFIPSLALQVRGGEEWLAKCGTCERRSDCRWCAAYAHLEAGRFSADIPYLCEVAEETARYKQERRSRHRRYFAIAGITIRLESDLPMDRILFAEALQPFEVQTPGNDVVTLKHVFGLPDLERKDLGTMLYDNPPWQIYRKGNSFIYVGITRIAGITRRHRVAVFDADYSHGVIYSPPREESRIRRQGFPSLTLFATDQILVAQLLARRRACFLHAAGAVLDGRGLLFVGHSGAGKSTTMLQLKGHAEILCDDRIVVRRWPEGFKIHGTWSHGDVPEVSPNTALLKAVFFLEQSRENRLVRIDDKQVITRRLLACLIRPLATRDWWENSLALVQEIVSEATCYEMRFDDSGNIVPLLKEIVHGIR